MTAKPGDSSNDSTGDGLDNRVDCWESDNIECASPERRTAGPLLRVDVEGFEGPLDLLLELSRSQKEDLAKISILALAEQYLAFIEKVRKLLIVP